MDECVIIENKDENKCLCVICFIVNINFSLEWKQLFYSIVDEEKGKMGLIYKSCKYYSHQTNEDIEYEYLFFYTSLDSSFPLHEG